MTLHSPAGEGGVAFADVQRVLQLLAQALAGAPVALGVAEAEVPSAAAAPSTLLLPARIDQFGSARANFGAYRIALLRGLGWQQAGQAWLQAAGGVKPRLWCRLFECLERWRIDLALPRRYPGAAADLRRVQAAALAQRPALHSLTALEGLLERLQRRALGAELPPLLELDRTGLLPALLAAAAPLQAEHATVQHSAAAARACLRLLAPLAGGEADLASPLPWPGPADQGATPLGDGPGEGQGAGPGDAEDEGRPRQARRRAGAGGRLADGPGTEQAGREHDPADPAAPAPAGPTPALPAAADASSCLVDEWDHRQQRLLPGWCRLHVLRPQGGDLGFVRATRRRHAGLLRLVRHQFATLRPEALQVQRRCRDGDEPDFDALVTATLDRRRGLGQDDRVQRRRLRARREVAAAFLVDQSASTDFVLPEPGAANPAPRPADEDDDSPYLYGPVPRRDQAPPALKRRVIDVEKEAVALMCDALQTLGDAFAVYGFSGEGRGRVEFLVAKDFHEPMNRRSWSALAALQPRGATRMGAAIRHALARLQRQPARRKLLIVLSDGYPQDQDYGPDRLDEAYALEDTAHALRQAEQAGVQTFCLTVDPAGHDYLRRMCSEHHYRVIDEVAALPQALSQVYRLLSAR